MKRMKNIWRLTACACSIFMLCSCSVVMNGESDPALQTDPVAQTTMAQTTAPGIEASSESEVVAETTTTVATTAKIKVWEDKMVSTGEENEDEQNGELSNKEIKNLIISGLKAVNSKDYEKMFKITNIGDIYRYEFTEPMQDDKIKELLINGGETEFSLEKWKKQISSFISVKEQGLDKPERLTNEEIQEIVGFLSQTAKGSYSEYSDGYRVRLNSEGSQKHIYVFKDEAGIWRTDLGLGLSYDRKQKKK